MSKANKVQAQAESFDSFDIVIADNHAEDDSVLMNVDRFLRRVPQEQGINDLIRSLYSSKIQSFKQWKSTLNSILNKKVW